MLCGGPFCRERHPARWGCRRLRTAVDWFFSKNALTVLVRPTLSMPKHNWTGGWAAREAAAPTSPCGPPAPVLPSGGLGVADPPPSPLTNGLPAIASDGPTNAALGAPACPLPVAPATAGAAVASAAAVTSASSPDQFSDARSPAGGGSCAGPSSRMSLSAGPSSHADHVDSDHVPGSTPSPAEGPAGSRVGRSKNSSLATRLSTMACTAALGLTRKCAVTSGRDGVGRLGRGDS